MDDNTEVDRLTESIQRMSIQRQDDDHQEAPLCARLAQHVVQFRAMYLAEKARCETLETRLRALELTLHHQQTQSSGESASKTTTVWG